MLRNEVERGLRALCQLGFNVRMMPNARGARGWTSGTVAERLADLHDAFADPTVRAIMYTIGGLHSAQLLSGLDWNLVAANPKILCGYSDATTLLTAVHQRTGMVTYYGPALIPQFGELPSPYAETVDHFVKVVADPVPAGRIPRIDYEVVDLDFQRREREQRPRDRRAAAARRVLRPGHVIGPALAACLPSLCSLIGTPWQPEVAGRVLFLETPEPPYSPANADADLWHLRNSGLLSDVAAVVFGRPLGWSQADADAFYTAAMECLDATTGPVLARLEFGHTNPMVTIPLGVEMAVTDDEVVILGPGVA